MNSNNFISKLKPIDKASVRIDLLYIDKYVLREMSEFYKDKEVNLIIESFQIFDHFYGYLPDQDAEFINKISPKIFSIKGINWTVKNIKALALLNWTNIDVRF